MDFANAVERLAKQLEAANTPWAVIGGLALAAHGAGRLTYDLDVATESGAQADLVRFLEHLVAMKVLAAKNDPTRRLQEMADIEALRRARDGSRMTPADIAAAAQQLGPPSAHELRSRRGPRGEPFRLPPETAT